MSTSTDSPVATEEEASFFTDLAEGVSNNEDEQQQEANSDADQIHDSQQEEIEEIEQEDEEAAEYEEADSKREKSPKDDPDAFQHWQSRYQKAETKFSELGIKPEEIPDEYIGLLNAFHGNPEYLDKFAEFISSGAQPTQSNSQPKEESKGEVQRPVAPEKPANYDPYAAYQDPDSDSFKYQRELEQYLVKKAEFAEYRAEQANKELQADKQQRQQETEAQKHRRQWEQKLKSERGYTDEQVDDFFGFVNKATKGKFEPDEVVHLYEGFSGIKSDQANGQEDASARKKEVEQKKKMRKKHAPSPASTGGAGNPGGKEADEKNSFFQKKTY